MNGLPRPARNWVSTGIWRMLRPCSTWHATLPGPRHPSARSCWGSPSAADKTSTRQPNGCASWRPPSALAPDNAGRPAFLRSSRGGEPPDDVLAELLDVGPRVGEDPHRRVVSGAQNAKQHVAGRDFPALEPNRLSQRELERLLGVRRKWEVAARHPSAPIECARAECRLGCAADDIQIDAKRSQRLRVERLVRLSVLGGDPQPQV